MTILQIDDVNLSGSLCVFSASLRLCVDIFEKSTCLKNSIVVGCDLDQNRERKMSATATPVSTKESMEYTLEALNAFLQVAEKAQTLPRQRCQDLKKKCEVLKKDLKDDSVMALRSFIKEVNQALPEGHAPFPPFATDYPENQLKNDIIAFELYLNLLLKCGDLVLEKEAPLFSEAIHLWRDVGHKLSAKEGLSQFIKLIQKGNSYLPQNQQFPLPPHNKYS
jgi:hypothetical protein